jgi:hypothetical protein
MINKSTGRTLLGADGSSVNRMVSRENKMSVLFVSLFVIAASAAIYSLFVSLRDYFPQVREIMNSHYSSMNSCDAAYAVWPTRLRLNESAITGVPQVLFRRRPMPFARKVSWRPAANGLPRVTRHLRYAAAPEQVIVLS